MNPILAPIKKYATFSGRASNNEFWGFFFFATLASIGLMIISGFGLFPLPIRIVQLVLSVFLLIPFLAVTVRRLHDTNRSGWWVFLLLLPFIGNLWLLLLVATKGDEGPNNYGPDPLEPVHKSFNDILDHDETMDWNDND